MRLGDILPKEFQIKNVSNADGINLIVIGIELNLNWDM